MTDVPSSGSTADAPDSAHSSATSADASRPDSGAALIRACLAASFRPTLRDEVVHRAGAARHLAAQLRTKPDEDLLAPFEHEAIGLDMCHQRVAGPERELPT